MELDQQSIEIDYNNAVIILKDLRKEKYYWGDQLLNLYRGHKNYIKGTAEMTDFDLEWYVTMKIKTLLECVVKAGGSACFKIALPKQVH